MSNPITEFANATWNPIESAPKDGTSILLWDGYRMEVGWWGLENLFDHKAWVYGECYGEYNSHHTVDTPTHWLSLPSEPR